MNSFCNPFTTNTTNFTPWNSTPGYTPWNTTLGFTPWNSIGGFNWNGAFNTIPGNTWGWNTTPFSTFNGFNGPIGFTPQFSNGFNWNTGLNTWGFNGVPTWNTLGGFNKGFTGSIPTSFPTTTPWNTGLTPGFFGGFTPWNTFGFNPTLGTIPTPFFGFNNNLWNGLPLSGFTPGLTPGMTPGFVPGFTPGFVPGMTPNYVPGFTPNFAGTPNFGGPNGGIPGQNINTTAPFAPGVNPNLCREAA